MTLSLAKGGLWAAAGGSCRNERSAFDAGGGMGFSDGLALRRAALAKVDGEHHHAAHGQELRLPVLQGPGPEVGIGQVVTPAHGCLQVLEAGFVEGSLTSDGL